MSVAKAEAKCEDMGLGEYLQDLKRDGYCIVPPAVSGMTDELLEQLTTALMHRCEELVGCPWTLDGPAEEVDFGGFPGTLEQIHAARQDGGAVEPSQFQLMQLCKHDRAFRDTAVNPVAAALIRSMIGHYEAKFSSHNCFVKWQGDGYGEYLGLHADQGLPSKLVLNANVNWALTEYTLEDGPVRCPGFDLSFPTALTSVCLSLCSSLSSRDLISGMSHSTAPSPRMGY